MLTNVFKIMSLLDYNNTILKDNKLLNHLFNINELRFLNYFKSHTLNISSCSRNTNDILIVDNEPLSILENNSDLSSSMDDSILSNHSYLSVNSIDSYISFDNESISLSSNESISLFDNESISSSSNESISSYDNESISSFDNESILSYETTSDYSIKSNCNLNTSIVKSPLNESFTNKEINFDYIEYDSEQSNLSKIILESKYSDNNIQYDNTINNDNNHIYTIIKYDYDIFYNYLTKLDLIKTKNLHLYNKLQNRGLYLNLHIIQNGFFELLEYYENKN